MILQHRHRRIFGPIGPPEKADTVRRRTRLEEKFQSFGTQTARERTTFFYARLRIRRPQTSRPYIGRGIQTRLIKLYSLHLRSETVQALKAERLLVCVSK